MTIPTNPKTLTLTAPTEATNQAGQQVPWNGSTDQAGLALSFDGAAPVTVAETGNATSINLLNVPAYLALAAGQHTVTVAEVTQEGVTGQPSAPVTFLTALVPLAPTSVVVA